ncbi:MAG TPA: hypothetical protein VK255_01045, partial [Patescibacteria group bacterium]|nr:hypothetical protein [Patescibacteria group bacterium]
FPFIVEAKAPANSKIYTDGDEETRSQWYTREEIRNMVRNSKISDMVSCFFLLSAGIIKTEDFDWKEIK